MVWPPQHCGSAAHRRVELDPKAVVYTLPENIKWVENERAGNAQAVIAGDPSKPGLYVVLTKWLAGNISAARISIRTTASSPCIKGTWWVGSGPNFDTQATVPLRPARVVTHYGKQVHYDGAKDEDAVLTIVGEGPATSTPFVAAEGMEK
jgi:hypothetical protein